MLKPLFLGLAMTTLVAACTEDYTDWAKPQNHPQGEAKTITAVVDSVKAIDLNVLGEQAVGAKVAVLQSTVTGAPRTAFSYQITLTPAEGLSGDQKATTIVADSLGKVAVAELQDAVLAYYGKAPRQRQLNAKVVSLANVNDESYRFESETAVRFTPTAPIYSETMDVKEGGTTVASLITKEFDGYYEGFAQIAAPFTLEYGKKKQQTALNANSFLLLNGNFAADAQQNITAPAAGLYWLRADVKTEDEYKLTPTAITRVAVVGSLNNWANDGKTDTPMTYNATEDCYEVTTEFDGGEFKFRFNAAWDIDLGGTLNNLTFKGANLKIDKGTYLVRLYLNQQNGKPMRATMTAR